MNATFILIVIALGLIASLVAGIRYARSSSSSNNGADLRSLAESEGWTYDDRQGGPTVFTMSDGEWTLEGKFFAGSNRAAVSSPHQTTWSGPAALAGTVMIGPKLPPFVANADLGGPEMQSRLQPLLGDKVALLAGAERLSDVGSDAFRKKFDVFASHRDTAEALIADGARWIDLRRLVGANIIITCGEGSVSILVRGKLRNAAQARALIDTGRSLL